MPPHAVSLALTGDVMLGRGVDQVLPHPGSRELREPCISDALHYVASAERRSGAIPRPVAFSWPWGEALDALREADARIINLETAITDSDDFAARKQVHYRLNPANLEAVSVAALDVCVLSNNHTLDFGRRGLEDTLRHLEHHGLNQVGAGGELAQARRPAVVRTVRGELRVFGCGASSSGIPASWAATEHRAGVNHLPEISPETAHEVLEHVQQHRGANGLTVVSLHWGSNWGYRVPQAHVDFAHRLVDGGVDVVHGHSSHHPRPVEVYRGKLILYGCGDFIDDYEGISGHREYRDELRLLYSASVLPGSGELVDLRMLPLRAHQLRLRPASEAETSWLQTTLHRISAPFGSRIERSGRELVLATPSRAG